MLHYFTPMMTESFKEDGDFDSQDCATFEISNTGQTSVFLNGIYELKPNCSEYYPPLGHCMLYHKLINFTFKSEDGKKNQIMIKASRYDRSC